MKFKQKVANPPSRSVDFFGSFLLLYKMAVTHFDVRSSLEYYCQVFFFGADR